MCDLFAKSFTVTLLYIMMKWCFGEGHGNWGGGGGEAGEKRGREREGW